MGGVSGGVNLERKDTVVGALTGGSHVACRF